MSDPVIFRKATAQELLDAARRTKTDAFAAPVQVHRSPKNTPLIEFEVTACDDPYTEATATVLRMPCGFRIPGIDGCSVTVHDMAGCFLRGPDDEESEDPSPSIGEIGYAVLMQETGGESAGDDCTLDADDECKWVIISMCQEASEASDITIRGVQPCEVETAYYNETADTLTFGSGLVVETVSTGHSLVSLGVELTGQSIVNEPCGDGASPDQTSTNEFTQINFGGNLTLNPSTDNPCIVDIESHTVFAVDGAMSTVECEVECGQAEYSWSVSSQAWTLVSGCEGDRCETPDAPTDSPAADETRFIDCIPLPEPITPICVNARRLEFSELFSVAQPSSGRAFIDIDLCRLFNDPNFKDFLCDAVEDCLEDRFDGLCEELEECIDDRIDDKLNELCVERSVLVPVDETLAGTVEDTDIVFQCETLRYVACPTGDASVSCGTRIVEGTDCPEDNQEEPAGQASAGCSESIIKQLMQTVAKLEARIAHLESR
jgi:hypothetical protein